MTYFLRMMALYLGAALVGSFVALAAVGVVDLVKWAFP
jgi:hypothetical protein